MTSALDSDSAAVLAGGGYGGAYQYPFIYYFLARQRPEG